jgi:uncharacterized protein (DUF58 family)
MDSQRVCLDSRRIYILPTGAGMLYAVMLTTMLLGAMNYNNNLGFAATFLLASLGTVSIYHCHRMLAGLRIHYLGAAPVFAGDQARVRFTLLNDSRQSRDEIRFGWDRHQALIAELAPLESRLLTLNLPTDRRGPLRLPAVEVSAYAPLGLVRAWTWLHLDSAALVYPRPAAQGVPLPPDGADRETGTDLRHGEEDFAGLRAFRHGDPPRRIAWKAYARTGELLVREHRGGAVAQMWIDWDQLPAPDIESRVSQMTRLVIDAHRDGRQWGLRLPDQNIRPGRGPEHFHRCLASLAGFRLPADTVIA